MKKMPVLISLTSFSMFCLFLIKTCSFQPTKTSFTSQVSLPENKERPVSPKTEELSLKSVPDVKSKSAGNKNDDVFKDSLLNGITSPPLKYFSGKN
jgi:hypothetical protein